VFGAAERVAERVVDEARERVARRRARGRGRGRGRGRRSGGRIGAAQAGERGRGELRRRIRFPQRAIVRRWRAPGRGRSRITSGRRLSALVAGGRCWSRRFLDVESFEARRDLAGLRRRGGRHRQIYYASPCATGRAPELRGGALRAEKAAAINING
jgi:hypothetical protein